MKHALSKRIDSGGALPAHHLYRECVVVKASFGRGWFVLASPHASFPKGLKASTRDKLLFLIDRALDRGA